MAKLNIQPSPNPREEKPAFLRNDEDRGEFHETREDAASVESKKRKRDFEVVDAQALYAVYPQFFKLIPDLAKIRQAIKLGLSMPGVEFGVQDSLGGEDNV